MESRSLASGQAQVFAYLVRKSDRAGCPHELSLRPHGLPLPDRRFDGIIGLQAIPAAIAGFHLLSLKALQVITKRPAHQRRAVHPRAPGGPISGAEQFGIENDLDRFHTVEYTPQISPQSTSLKRTAQGFQTLGTLRYSP